MLAASMEANGEVAVAHLGVVGLECDASLWKAVAALQQQCTQPDRVVPVSWERLLEGLAHGDLADDARRMAARYIPG